MPDLHSRVSLLEEPQKHAGRFPIMETNTLKLLGVTLRSAMPLEDNKDSKVLRRLIVQLANRRSLDHTDRLRTYTVFFSHSKSVLRCFPILLSLSKAN